MIVTICFTPPSIFRFFLTGRTDWAVIVSTVKCLSVLGYSWIISYLFLSFSGTDAKDRKLGKDDVQFVSDNEESTARGGYTDDVFWNDQRIGKSEQNYPQKFQTVIEKNNDSENWNSIPGGMHQTSSENKPNNKHYRREHKNAAPNRQDSFLV
jgi:hypothetical protein